MIPINRDRWEQYSSHSNGSQYKYYSNTNNINVYSTDRES